MKKLLLFAIFAMGATCYGQPVKYPKVIITSSTVESAINRNFKAITDYVNCLSDKIDSLIDRVTILEKQVDSLENTCLAVKQDSARCGWISRVVNDSLFVVEYEYTQTPSYGIYRDLYKKKK